MAACWKWHRQPASVPDEKVLWQVEGEDASLVEWLLGPYVSFSSVYGKSYRIWVSDVLQARCGIYRVSIKAVPRLVPNLPELVGEKNCTLSYQTSIIIPKLSIYIWVCLYILS